MNTVIESTCYTIWISGRTMVSSLSHKTCVQCCVDTKHSSHHTPPLPPHTSPPTTHLPSHHTPPIPPHTSPPTTHFPSHHTPTIPQTLYIHVHTSVSQRVPRLWPEGEGVYVLPFDHFNRPAHVLQDPAPFNRPAQPVPPKEWYHIAAQLTCCR